MKSVCSANSLKSRLRATIAAVLMSSAAHAELLETSTAELQKLIDKQVPVVDVRTPNEWRAGGIIAGSKLLTFFDEHGNYDVERWLMEFSRIAQHDEPVIIICAVGNRSSAIGRFLSERAGYHQIHNATQGIEHWKQAGLPLQGWP